MNTLEIRKLRKQLFNHPLVKSIVDGDGTNGEIGEVYIITTEDPDDYDSHLFPAELDKLSIDYEMNECEGCFNEFVIR